jgi:uncharacterized LabA/DUF88 family protein
MVGMAANVYIDGFNLYYGAARGTPYKWLDIQAMCHKLLPGRQINRIRYFTARVIGFPHDPDAPLRQDVYLRALRTFAPVIQIHADGWFASHPVLLPQFPLAYRNSKKPPQLVQVQRNEEKRTDVDLATHLLLDCFRDEADEFVVISNDSDLVLPINLLKTEFGKIAGVINPHKATKMSGHLKKVATWYMNTINPSVLRNCQLPTTMSDVQGTFTKPVTW